MFYGIGIQLVLMMDCRRTDDRGKARARWRWSSSPLDLFPRADVMGSDISEVGVALKQVLDLVLDLVALIAEPGEIEVEHPLALVHSHPFWVPMTT